MKRLQSYLLKPQELRKKLQNPRFRQEFIQWSKGKGQPSRDSQTRQQRSKSPVENIQKSIQINPKKISSNKENLRQQSSQKQIYPYKNQSRTVLGAYVIDRDRNIKSVFDSKRNSSSQSFQRQKVNRSTHQSLSNKNKSINSTLQKQKRQKSSSRLQSQSQQLPSFVIKQNYSYRTRQGAQAHNPNKVNQDSLLIKTNLAQRSMNVYAIADGHGANGHYVSQYLVKNFAGLCEKQFKETEIEKALPKVFEQLQKGLTGTQVNATYSGSTLVSVIIQENQIICSNVGDSRAILARQIDRKSWELIYLSQDHKPCVQAEKKRILECGGRIHAFKDERGVSIGPQRAWLPDQNVQGLAMSRSMGDNISKPIGVISQPQIIKVRLDKRDKFILLASDGVWEFISNQQVLQLLVPYYKQNRLEEACDALAKLAYERWTSEDSSVVDDITLILIFLSQ